MKAQKYGVSEETVLSDPLDEHREHLIRDGFTVFRSNFTDAEVSAVSESFESASRTYKIVHGEDRLAALDEQHMLRAPIATGDPVFKKIAFLPTLMQLLSSLLLSKFYLNQQNGVINPPNSEYSQGRWHRDLPYQHWTISRPIAINALYCVDDFTHENGSTWVIPGSHLHSEFPSAAYVEKNAVQIEARAGDFLVLDCMVYHSGGQNSTGSPRRGLNHVYTIPLLAPQISWPDVLDSGSFSEQELELLGFPYRVPRSLDEYWSQRSATRESRN